MAKRQADSGRDRAAEDVVLYLPSSACIVPADRAGDCGRVRLVFQDAARPQCPADDLCFLEVFHPRLDHHFFFFFALCPAPPKSTPGPATLILCPFYLLS